MVQQIVCNNGTSNLQITPNYTILSSLYQSASSHWERGWIDIGQFFENSFCPIEEANRIGNNLNSENIKILWRSSFLFPRQRLLSFLNFMKTRANITKSTLTEVWPWHSRSKNRKITRKISCKFCKCAFFEG